MDYLRWSSLPLKHWQWWNGWSSDSLNLNVHQDARIIFWFLTVFIDVLLWIIFLVIMRCIQIIMIHFQTLQKLTLAFSQTLFKRGLPTSTDEYLYWALPLHICLYYLDSNPPPPPPLPTPVQMVPIDYSEQSMLLLQFRLLHSLWNRQERLWITDLFAWISSCSFI